MTCLSSKRLFVLMAGCTTALGETAILELGMLTGFVLMRELEWPCAWRSVHVWRVVPASKHSHDDETVLVAWVQCRAWSAFLTARRVVRTGQLEGTGMQTAHKYGPRVAWGVSWRPPSRARHPVSSAHSNALGFVAHSGT